MARNFAKGERPLNERGYIAAEVDRLTGAWTTMQTDVNYDLKELGTLQARAREELRNNEYVRRFVGMVRNNIVGPEGVKLQVKAMTARGAPDKPLNDVVEAQWGRWGQKGVCDVTGRYTFNDLQNLVVTGLVIDGEAFVRRIRNWNGNSWGYALQFIDPARLPVSHNDADANIQLSIENNEWGRPVAYHIAKKLQSPVNTPFTNRRQEYERIPADQILHFYMPDLANQDRGVPALAATMRNLNMLRGYQEAELVAARQHANQVGFFERDPNAATGFVGDGEDGIGNLYMDSEPGEWRELPAGVKANWVDPSHPNQAYKDFIKAMLRSISSGLGVNYNTLSNDLEGVNFSSLRQGALDERETWKCLQQHLKNHFLQVIYDDWLLSSLQRGQLPTGGRPIEQQREKLQRVVWQPRRWDWVDPVKNEQAHGLAIQNRTKWFRK